MSLSAEQYKEITKSLRAHGWVRPKHAEKRVQPRVGLRSHLSIRPRQYGQAARKPLRVWLRSLSHAGLGIIHSQPLEEGTEFIADFPGFNDRNVSVVYTVAHCQMLSKTLFGIGATLKTVLAAA